MPAARAVITVGSSAILFWYGAKAVRYCYGEYRGWKEDTARAQEGRAYA